MALLPLASWGEAATMVSLPSLTTGLVYNGDEQTLLTGTAEFPADYDLSVGGIVYAVTATDAAPTEEGSADFPTATNAGLYYVWYKVKSDGEYTAGDWTKVNTTGKVRISPATPNITAPTAASLTYTGEDQALLAAEGSTDFGTLKYCMTEGGTYIEYTDENFATTIKGLNAGEYTVYLKVAADGEGNWVEKTSTKTVTIAKKNLGDEDVQITLRDGFVAPVYSNAAKTLELTDIVVTWNKAGGDVVLNNNGTDYAIDNYLVEGEASNINAGTATCNLKSGSNNNFTGGLVTFTIDPKPITAAMFTIADVTYTGATITQANLRDATGFVANDAGGNLTADDYTLTTSAKNVTTDDGSTVTIAGTRNYTGELTANFDVTKAKLTVNATAYTTSRGTAVTSELLASNYEITGWVGEDADADPKPTVTGAPTVALAAGKNTNTAGLIDDAIEITSVAEMSADNYTFVASVTKAQMTVEATRFTAAFKSDIAYYYKDKWIAPADLDATKNYFDISVPTAITAMTIALYDSEDVVVADNTELEVGSTYTLKVTAKTISGDYQLDGDGEIADKTITVQKLPIQIIAQAQNIAYPAGEASVAKNEDEVDDVYTSWSDAIVTIADAEGTAYNKGDFSAKYGVWKKDFIESLAWSGDKTLASPGTITVTLKADYDTDNFNIIGTTAGDVTFTGVPATITLNRAAKADFEDAEKNNTQAVINEYNGVVKPVTFGDFTMLPEKWYPLVLPFATDVATVSQKFGYAVVNILSDNQPDLAEGKVNLKLHMQEIAAGQPFVVKVYKEINMNTVTFDGEGAGVEISNATPIDEKTGVSFIGTYTGKTDGFRSNQLYFSASSSYNQYYPGNETNKTYLRPLGAYFELTNGATAREIIFQEADGSTTAIKVANPENNASAEGMYTVGGVKLQGAPTQKGVYIQNGKKVVIK